ncbi:preprotein translocase subunit SecY, partial [Enterococcus faecalis]
KTGIVTNPNLSTVVKIGINLPACTMFVTWMGEQITEQCIGNVVSMIIFAVIISRVPASVKEIYEDYFINIDTSRIWQSAIFIVILIIAILVIVTV